MLLHYPPVAARVKGRLQYRLRRTIPKAFQRNYSIHGIGSTRRDKLDNYIDSQLEHHPLADARLQERFAQ
jgi:REP element-mobilizing transposase RayT